MFEDPICLEGVPLKSHLTHTNQPNQPSDWFLCLHFTQCLTVSACCSDITEDHEVVQIEGLMEHLGVYTNEIDISDPGWSTPLGMQIFTYLLGR